MGESKKKQEAAPKTKAEKAVSEAENPAGTEQAPQPEHASESASKDTAETKAETGTEPETKPEEPDPLKEAQEKLRVEHDQYLRLAAEYDNFRKRSQREKDNIYSDAKCATVEKFLPVYDNLSRALEQETADAAYKKGVEMTMSGLQEILKKMDVTIYGEPGDTFSPDLHNAVLHIEDTNYKEGQIVEVFQKGFKIGERVIRFAMVQTAN